MFSRRYGLDIGGSIGELASYGVYSNNEKTAKHLLNYIKYINDNHSQGIDDPIIRFNNYCRDHNVNAAIKTSIYGGDLEFNLRNIDVETFQDILRSERNHLSGVVQVAMAQNLLEITQSHQR